jgi:hypothetical protein
VAINAVAPVGGLTTIQVNTSSPHGLTGTPEVFASGVGGVPAANGRWFADVVNPTTINLRGSIFSGSYTSGGTISSSSEKFVPMTEVEAILAGNTLSGTLGTWAWQDQALHFIGATAARQLWIPYLNSGAPPPSGNIGIDDARDFLAYATAAYAAPTQDMATRRAELLVDSFGPTKQADGSGGLLRDLVLPMLNQKNRLQKRSGRFGARSVDPARRIFV